MAYVNEKIVVKTGNNAFSSLVDIKDKNGNLLKNLSFSNVNLKVGYITTYTGKLFEQSNTADFTFADTGFADSRAGTTFEE